MKKSIKDLTEKDVIATPTLEDWLAVKKLFPKINLRDELWEIYKEQMCIRPLGSGGTGTYCSKEWYSENSYTINHLSDILEYEPPFNPKLGELVRVDESGEPRIYLFSHVDFHYCVNRNEAEKFHEGKSFSAVSWSNIYPYTPPITLTPEQAIEKLKQLTDFSGKEIKIEG